MQYLIQFMMVTVAMAVNPFGGERKKCQPITVDMCKFSENNGYKFTMFPNDMYRTQKEANFVLQPFKPLIQTKCHQDIKLFLCSQYVPLCIENLPSKTLRPCQSLCQQAQNGCQKLMRSHGFDWPFNCSQYPGEGEMCVSSSKAVPQTTAAASNVTKPMTAIITTLTKKPTKPTKPRRKRGKVAGKEGEKVEMKCKKGFSITIKKVVHKNSKCCASISKQILSIMCRQKKSCRFTVDQSTFGGHCFGNVGTVIVRYKCERNNKKENKNKDYCK